jgi:2-oxoglutarate ferredoxin oxidoreductase subunit alpha
MRDYGLNVYTERDVLSRIRGGHTAATVRAFSGDRYCIGSNIDLLVALDDEAIEKNVRHLNSNSIVVYDESGGKINGSLPKGIKLYSAPFNRIAMRTMRRELYRNSIAFGVVARLIGLEDESLRDIFKKRFARLGTTVLDYNLEALDLGFGIADEFGLSNGAGLYKIKKKKAANKLLITGNESVALGFIVAGGRFFAGYPITPSSEILESLQKWLPMFGGVARQTEDELSGINMAIGAALTGARVMVGTSGPGFSLMQEGVGHAGSAEIPIVIVDCQRAGPSTGMPTKPEQSDLNLMIFGGHGDFPRIVLAPGHPEDCFYLTVQATNLASKYQCPVYISMDQGLSQNIATVDPFDLDNVEVESGFHLNAKDLEKLDAYKRYAHTENDVSPIANPGTPGGFSLVTGNEHDEWGLVSTDPDNRVKMMEKRMNKIEHAKEHLPKARHFGNENEKIGFIGIGMTYGVILEVMEQLEADGVGTQFLQLRTIWPVLDEVHDFINRCDKVYVIEYNAVGQLAHLLMHQGADSSKIIKILKYNGIPYRPFEIYDRVMNDTKSKNSKKGNTKKEANSK